MTERGRTANLSTGDTFLRPGPWDASGRLDPDYLQRFNAVLATAVLRPFEKDPALWRLIAEYERAGDFGLLVKSLDAFLTENALYVQTDAVTMTIEVSRGEDLRLMGSERRSRLPDSASRSSRRARSRSTARHRRP